MYAEKYHLTIIDAIIQFRLMLAQEQLIKIHENGAIYINSSGGYHSNSVYKQYVIKKDLIFPQYDKSDIKIEEKKKEEKITEYPKIKEQLLATNVSDEVEYKAKKKKKKLSFCSCFL